jgi:hypothetical protein
MNEEKTGKCLRQVEQEINESVIFLVEQELLTLSERKRTKDKQWYTHTTKHWLARIPLKIRSELRLSESVSNSCSTRNMTDSFITCSTCRKHFPYCMSFSLRLLITSLVPSQPYSKNIYKGINHFKFFALKPNYYWRL